VSKLDSIMGGMMPMPVAATKTLGTSLAQSCFDSLALVPR
jgi:hypothetical protein